MRASAGEQLPVRMVEMLLMGAEVTDFKENITIIFFLHFTHNSIVMFFSSLSYFLFFWIWVPC